MSYSVVVDDAVKEKIARWTLSPYVHSKILGGFDDLGSSPRSKLVRVGPPHDRLQHDLVIEDPTPPPRDYLFVFSVLYNADEETLHIVDCDYIAQDHTDHD